MKQRDYAIYGALTLSLTLVALIAYLEADSVWAFSHIKYFGDYLWHFVGALMAAVLVLTLAILPENAIERAGQAVAGWIWSGSIVPKVVLSVGFTGLFYLFRVSTAFLGDGYFLLNVFGRNEAYTSNLVKPLSIWIIKTIQMLFGGYTYWNALYTFQTVSIVSGFFVLFNFITIAGMLTDSVRGRLFALGTLICSGWLLLFFGYIEYYPLLWLAASFFITQSIKCIQGNAPRWTVWLTFAITIAIHMQAVYFLPGVLYIQFHEQFSNFVSRMASKNRRWLLAIGLLLPFCAVLLADLLVPPISNPFLRFFPLGTAFPKYTVLSLGNLYEIANLVLLIVPSVLILLALAFWGNPRSSDRVARLLGLFSLGGLYFLILMNPKLGLARDWDLMSLTLLTPALFLLYRVGEWRKVSVGVLLASLVLSLGVTFSYLKANCSKASSERRCFDLLRHYGSKERGGWLSLASYLEHEGEVGFRKEVMTAMETAFPEQRMLEDARNLLGEDNLDEAELLALELIGDHPDNGLFHGLLAEIRFRQGRLAEAISEYKLAIKTHPSHRNYFGLGRTSSFMGNKAAAIGYLEQAYELAPQQVEVLAELCRTHAQMGQLGPAKRYGDELLALDPHAPDGLIATTIHASQRGDRAKATRFYREFLRYGQDHPDYELVKQAFDHLLH